MDANSETWLPSLHAALLVATTSAGSAAIVRTLEDHGFRSVLTSHWTELLQRVSDREPELVVVELGMTGSPGPRLVPMVRAVAPRTILVTISEIGSLEISDDQAERNLAVEPGDLRPLAAVLRRLRAA